MGFAATLRRRLFGISPVETDFARRGFRAGSPATRERLEAIGSAFVHGYNGALADPETGPLAAFLDRAPLERRGFAYEGAAMALTILDHLSPLRPRRLAPFLHGPGSRHVYMVHVGVGWALARLRRRSTALPRTLHPLYRWLAVDGFGFHQAYFHPERTYDPEHRVPGDGYARCAYDQGLGRAMWFVDCGDEAWIAARIGTLDARRHADLWSGVGLAAAYAGGVENDALDRLREVSRSHHSHLAQGAAFAAKAREVAGNPARHTERACRILCGVPADEAAAWTDAALDEVPGGAAQSELAYEAWRRKIRSQYLEKGAA